MSTPAAPPQISLLGRVTLVVVAVNLAVGGLVGVSIRGGLKDARAAAMRTALNLNHTVEEYLGALFDKIDFSLFTAAHETELFLAQSRIDEIRRGDFLAEHLSFLPGVQAYYIADEKGRLIFGDEPSRRSQPTVIAERPYFLAQRDDAAAGLYISPPFPNKITGEISLFLSRRINRPDGGFAGIVYAQLPLARIEEFLSRIDVGRTGGISLRDSGMGIIARHPDPGGRFRGNRTVSPELRTFLGRGENHGAYYSPGTWDGTARTVAFSRVGRYPFYVNVGIGERDYLADWRESTMRILALYAAFAAATAIGATLVYRSSRARIRAARAAFAEMERRVAEATVELRTYSAALEATNAELTRLAITDPLTGAANRRRFMEAAAAEIDRTARSGRPLALLMLDIDHFKRVNDTWGHAAGDDALCAVVAVCTATVRRVDLVARLGGEEFAVLMPETGLSEATAIAERLRAAIAAIEIPVADGRLRFTASLGIATLADPDEPLSRFLSRADDALYRAKDLGRNRCETAALS